MSEGRVVPAFFFCPNFDKCSHPLVTGCWLLVIGNLNIEQGTRNAECRSDADTSFSSTLSIEISVREYRTRNVVRPTPLQTHRPPIHAPAKVAAIQTTR